MRWSAQSLPRVLRRGHQSAADRRRRRQRRLHGHRGIQCPCAGRQLRLGQCRREQHQPSLHQPDLLLSPTSGATRRSLAVSSITATNSPAAYKGSYFFADYAQNTIKRLTFDANGNVNGIPQFRARQWRARRADRRRRVSDPGARRRPLLHRPRAFRTPPATSASARSTGSASPVPTSRRWRRPRRRRHRVRRR